MKPHMKHYRSKKWIVSSAEDLSKIIGIATVSLLHSFVPTHWLPFSIVGRAQSWMLSRTVLYTDEEVECNYEEFCEDVHTEFLKFEEIVNFKALLAARNSAGVVFVGTFGAIEAMIIISVALGRTFHYFDEILPFRFILGFQHFLMPPQVIA